MDLKKNLSKYFSMNINLFLLVKDKRLGNHAKYQIGIKIKNQKEFDNVNDKLSNFLKKEHKCKKTKKNNNALFCNANNDWKIFGQQEGIYRTLYPSKFEGNKIYLINHGVQERLILNPKILTKDLINSYINELGRKYTSKKNSMKKSNNTHTTKSMKKSNNTHSTKSMKKNNNIHKSIICSKYKDKELRGTPVNWAYKRCMRQPTNMIDKCKTLPPSGWGMYRNFCD